MNQKKTIGIALLVVGIVLLFFGLNASNSPMEEMSEALTGQFSDRTMLYLIGGAISATLGAVMLFRK